MALSSTPVAVLHHQVVAVPRQQTPARRQAGFALVRMQQAGKVSAPQFGLRVPDHALEGGVACHDLALHVRDDDANLRMLKDLPVTRHVLLERDFRGLAFCDVDEDARQRGGPSPGILEDASRGGQPADRPIRPDDAIFGVVFFGRGFEGRCDQSLNTFAILRVQDAIKVFDSASRPAAAPDTPGTTRTTPTPRFRGTSTRRRCGRPPGPGSTDAGFFRLRWADSSPLGHDRVKWTQLLILPGSAGVPPVHGPSSRK